MNSALSLSRTILRGSAWIAVVVLMACSVSVDSEGEIQRAALIDRLPAGATAIAWFDIEALAARFTKEGTDSPELHEAWNELGAVLDELGVYDHAFVAFVNAGHEQSKTPPARAVDPDQRFREIDAFRAAVTPDLVGRWAEETFDDTYPPLAFLVGFPRSGTTMTEQILAAHPDVETTDETRLLFDVQRQIAEWYPQGAAAGLAQLTRRQVDKLRARYWKDARALLGDMPRDKLVVDKLPLNLIYAGVINAVFPDARLLVALRDPRDVVLSCFSQSFRMNAAMVNFLHWERTAAFYEKVMGLWLHQRDVLTLPRVEVRYEDTVRDLRGQAERVLDVLDVKWDDAVLSFHEHAAERSITTPSFQAVTEPVHERAVGRWRNYAKHYPGIMPTLQPFVEAFGYDG